MKKFISILVLTSLFLSSISFAAMVPNPLKISENKEEDIKKYFSNQINGQVIHVFGSIKDVEELKDSKEKTIYEIPVYVKEDGKYTKYGFVCQTKDTNAIIFVADSFFPMFVKKNVIDKTVMALGKLVEGRYYKELPDDLIFLVDSLQLNEFVSK